VIVGIWERILLDASRFCSPPASLNFVVQRLWLRRALNKLSNPPASHQADLRTRAERRAQQARQAERQARYEQITALQKQGMKSAEIAAVVGMAERTVRHWRERGDIPYSGPRKPRSSPLDPYKSYLLSRWHEGCHNVAVKRDYL
jgi:DNA-binding transcriptional regulator YiaG